MIKTISLTTRVKPNESLQLTLPSDVPEGLADIVVVITPREVKHSIATLGQLVDSEFIGMWRNRSDIQDSLEFARELRERAWNRYG